MSDPHEQANIQQIEWLLGALTETGVERVEPERSTDVPSPQDDPTDPGELH